MEIEVTEDKQENTDDLTHQLILNPQEEVQINAPQVHHVGTMIDTVTTEDNLT